MAGIGAPPGCLGRAGGCGPALAPPATLPGGCLECSPGSQELEGDVEGPSLSASLKPPRSTYAVFLLASAWSQVRVFCCKTTLFLALWPGTWLPVELSPSASWLFQLGGACSSLSWVGGDSRDTWGLPTASFLKSGAPGSLPPPSHPLSCV